MWDIDSVLIAAYRDIPDGRGVIEALLGHRDWLADIQIQGPALSRKLVYWVAAIPGKGMRYRRSKDGTIETSSLDGSLRLYLTAELGLLTRVEVPLNKTGSRKLVRPLLEPSEWTFRARIRRQVHALSWEQGTLSHQISDLPRVDMGRVGRRPARRR